MNTIHNWWSFPDWAKPVLLTAALAAVLAVLGWTAKRAMGVISEFAKRKHREHVEEFSRRVWAFVKSRCGPSTTGVPLHSIASHFRASETKTKEALRVLQTKGVLHPNVDETMWWLDAETRFFDGADVSRRKRAVNLGRMSRLTGRF